MLAQSFSNYSARDFTHVIQVRGFNETIEPDSTKLLITDGELLERYLRFLEDRDHLVIDYETNGTAWHQHARMCGVAFGAWYEGRQWNAYIPLRHDTGEVQLEYDRVAPALKRIIERPTLKIAHNIKFEDHFTRNEGWKLNGPRYDTMIAARIYDENKLLGLKHRAKSELGATEAVEWDKWQDKVLARLAKIQKLPIKEYKYRFGYSQVPIGLCGRYACWDAQFAGDLWRKYEAENLSTTYARIWQTEMILSEVLCDMEREGLPLDIEYFQQLYHRAEDTKANLEKLMEDQLRNMGLRMFNPGSDDDVQEFLRTQLGIKLHRRTKAQKYSVDRDALLEFEDQTSFIPWILKWRDAEKISSTYTLSLIKQTDKHGVLHPDFQQVGTNTGRLSCRSPNFQNMASDKADRFDDEGHDPLSVKRGFPVRAPNMPRLFMDYSQIELRVLAYYSRDPLLLDSYFKGQDVHTRTSLEVFGTDDKQMRRYAKIINFGLSYCLSDKGLATQAKIPEADAKKYLDDFFKKYAGIYKFRNEFWGQVRGDGCWFKNIFGRPRRIPQLTSFKNWERGRAERQAIGTLIQGTAAELTRESLVRIWQEFKARDLPVKLVNTVHDEIQVDVLDAKCLTDVVTTMKQLMEGFPEFDPVPIVVDGEYSTTNWAEKIALP